MLAFRMQLVETSPTRDVKLSVELSLSVAVRGASLRRKRVRGMHECEHRGDIMRSTTVVDSRAKAAPDAEPCARVSVSAAAATSRILGGIAGIGAAGLLGAVFGALGGLALERQMRGSSAQEAKDAAGEPDLTGPGRVEAETAVGIEPACPDCLAVRAASAGHVTWCARHSKPHPRVTCITNIRRASRSARCSSGLRRDVRARHTGAKPLPGWRRSRA